jgi:hypothetical protein
VFQVGRVCLERAAFIAAFLFLAPRQDDDRPVALKNGFFSLRTSAHPSELAFSMFRVLLFGF